MLCTECNGRGFFQFPMSSPPCDACNGRGEQAVQVKGPVTNEIGDETIEQPQTAAIRFGLSSDGAEIARSSIPVVGWVAVRENQPIGIVVGGFNLRFALDGGQVFVTTEDWHFRPADEVENPVFGARVFDGKGYIGKVTGIDEVRHMFRAGDHWYPMEEKDKCKFLTV